MLHKLISIELAVLEATENDSLHLLSTYLITVINHQITVSDVLSLITHKKNDQYNFIQTYNLKL